jgi:hypothetical protein
MITMRCQSSLAAATVIESRVGWGGDEGMFAIDSEDWLRENAAKRRMREIGCVYKSGDGAKAAAGGDAKPASPNLNAMARSHGANLSAPCRGPGGQTALDSRLALVPPTLAAGQNARDGVIGGEARGPRVGPVTWAGSMASTPRIQPRHHSYDVAPPT